MFSLFLQLLGINHKQLPFLLVNLVKPTNPTQLNPNQPVFDLRKEAEEKRLLEESQAKCEKCQKPLVAKPFTRRKFLCRLEASCFFFFFVLSSFLLVFFVFLLPFCVHFFSFVIVSLVCIVGVFGIIPGLFMQTRL